VRSCEKRFLSSCYPSRPGKLIRYPRLCRLSPLYTLTFHVDDADKAMRPVIWQGDLPRGAGVAVGL